MNQIILGTGNYDSVKSGNTVSITGDGGNFWNYFGPAYKKLAPRLETYLPYAEKYEELLEMRKDPSRVEEARIFRRNIEDTYIKSYYDLRLKNLNVNQLLDELFHRFGDHIILLCHEPVEEFCHRRVLADYIELETGIYIPEVEVDSNGLVKKIKPIRYKNRLRDVMK